ncbi:hypothetical protein FSARC_566 [Fusarium sarcochroum]|uniref:Uncharacterized protein n=1 Tax=Fusarium sarcochroum TaxID=1208366 RepID=A0A8H4XFD1_9HYPO|nr:hypothetical protein FSARC_566 [Fusarium sarcochroum]
MVFLSENAAQSFGTLVTNIRDKTGTEISLGTMAKLAGIDHSLVLTMDMALYLPDLTSTVAISYLNAISAFPPSTNDNDAEAFIPPLIVVDKLTHLDRPWKPVVSLDINGVKRRVPQTIDAEAERKLEWKDIAVIGHPREPEQPE